MSVFLLALLVLIPQFTSGGIAVSQGGGGGEGGFAEPDIWSWSFNDGTMGWPANGLGEHDFKNWFTAPPQPSVIVPDSTFPANIEATGYSCRHEYVIGAEEIGNIDRNRSVQIYPVNMGDDVPGADVLEHFWTRQWVKIGTPADNNIWVQRKLIYTRGDQNFNADWWVIVNSFSPPGATGAPLVLKYGDVNAGIDEVILNLDNAYTIFWDTWVGLKLEVLLNTPGLSDGRTRLKVTDATGTLVRDQTWAGLNIRGNTTKKLDLIEHGSQADRVNTGEVVNEFRWVNRLALSTVEMPA